MLSHVARREYGDLPSRGCRWERKSSPLRPAAFSAGLATDAIAVVMLDVIADVRSDVRADVIEDLLMGFIAVPDPTASPA